MKRLKAELVPVHEVTLVDGAVGRWRAEGYDPQFEISDGTGLIALKRGYYALEIENENKLSNILRPVIYYNSGSGYDSSLKIDLVFQPVGQALFRAYFVVPVNAVSIRFDPTESHSDFQIGTVSIMQFMRTEWYVSAARLLAKDREAKGITFKSYAKKAGDILRHSGVRGLAAKLRSSIGQHLVDGTGNGAESGYGRVTNPASQQPSNTSAQYNAKFLQLYFENSGISEGYRHPIFATDRAEGIDASRSDVKLIAYYLPQFHPFEQNDRWWGKGFTEWTNVTKAIPRFVGHYQPKLPGDLGFYDLRNVDTMRQQAALAKRFGVSGFCFHFYWFGGTRLMETPILNFREAEDIDFTYSLCWANENWSRRWDGAENELLISQVHSPEDDEAFMSYVAKTYFSDKRYIRIDNKPVLTVYRPDIIPDVKETVKRWRRVAKKLGFPDIYLVATNSFGFSNYKAAGFDALSEFPPHAVQADIINANITKFDERYAGGVFSYESLVRSQKNRKDTPPGIVFPGVMPAWDNVARRPLVGHVFHGSTPEKYREWLIFAIERVRKSNPEGQRIVMINAWNEWAEGAYLEPDRLFGHAYLWATGSAIENTTKSNETTEKIDIQVDAHNKKFKPKGKFAIAAHLYYQDTIDDLKSALEGKEAIDLYITVPDSIVESQLKSLIATFPRSHITKVSNCGRDVLPFIKVLKRIQSHPYDWVCKVHSKKSVHLGQGNLWRRELFGILFEGLTATPRKQSHSFLSSDDSVGMIGPAGSLTKLDDEWIVQNNIDGMNQIVSRLNMSPTDVQYSDHAFFAGTMFWFRPAALRPLITVELNDQDFGVELGRIDGTPAHAMERLFGVISSIAGFKLAEMSNSRAISVDISMAKRDRK